MRKIATITILSLGAVGALVSCTSAPTPAIRDAHVQCSTRLVNGNIVGVCR